MPDDIKRVLTVPVTVPVWSIIVIIVSLAYTTGMTLQKLDYLTSSPA